MKDIKPIKWEREQSPAPHQHWHISSTSNPQAHLTKAMDMDIDTSRGWSANSSTNNSRELSMHSSVSSITYANRVQALNNSPLWADQVKNSKSQEEITLSYVNPEMPFFRCPFLELTSLFFFFKSPIYYTGHSGRL